MGVTGTGGAPMGGPRYIWWNFVSSRPERIEQAKEEWARGASTPCRATLRISFRCPTGRTSPQRSTGEVFYP